MDVGAHTFLWVKKALFMGLKAVLEPRRVLSPKRSTMGAFAVPSRVLSCKKI